MNALRKLFGLRVLATLDNGEAVDGTLVSGDADWLSYEHATLFPASGGEAIDLDGVQFVARPRVVRLQVP